MATLVKRFCKNSHDVLTCGRTPTGKCRECGKSRTQKYRLNLRLTDPIRLQNMGRENNWKQAAILNLDSTLFMAVDYDRLYQIQQGKCTICNRHQSELGESLSVDHDHKTGVVRGLLCRRCNSRINIFDDESLTATISKYLKIKVVKEN